MPVNRVKHLGGLILGGLLALVVAPMAYAQSDEEPVMLAGASDVTVSLEASEEPTDDYPALHEAVLALAAEDGLEPPTGPAALALVIDEVTAEERWVPIKPLGLDEEDCAPLAVIGTGESLAAETLADDPFGEQQQALTGQLCFGEAWRLSATGGSDEDRFTLSISPVEQQCEDGTCSSRQISSRLQLGLESLNGGEKPGEGWFIFAGADDKAVMWRPGSRQGASGDGELILHDSVTVGDIEAGLALKGKRSELSVSYIHRETSYRINQEQKLTDTEGYVGVVLRLK